MRPPSAGMVGGRGLGVARGRVGEEARQAPAYRFVVVWHAVTLGADRDGGGSSSGDLWRTPAAVEKPGYGVLVCYTPTRRTGAPVIQACRWITTLASPGPACAAATAPTSVT